MSDLSFKPYQDAYDSYRKDLEQLRGISDRLMASALGVKAERISETEKLGKLKTIQVQMDKLDAAINDADHRFDAAIDVADEAIVQRAEGICAYAEATGQGDAGSRYLLQECKEYARAKGDFKLRRALHAQICDVLGSVVEAGEGKKSSSPVTPHLDQFESIGDPEDASAYYRQHQDVILSQMEARRNAANQP